MFQGATIYKLYLILLVIGCTKSNIYIFIIGTLDVPASAVVSDSVSPSEVSALELDTDVAKASALLVDAEEGDGYDYPMQ